MIAWALCWFGSHDLWVPYQHGPTVFLRCRRGDCCWIREVPA